MLFDTRMKALIAYIKSLNITKRSLFEKEEMIGSNEAKVVAQNLYKKIAVEISKLRRRFSDFEKEDFISLSPLKRRKYIEYLRKTALDNQLLNLESLRKEIQKLKSNHSIYIKIDKIWIELLMTLRVPYERMLSLEREIEDIIGHEIFFNRFTRNELNDINLPTDCLNSPKLTEAGHREFDKQKETNDKVLFYRRIIKNGLNKKTRNRKCDCINSGLNKIIWETDFESEKGINDLLADFKQNVDCLNFPFYFKCSFRKYPPKRRVRYMRMMDGGHQKRKFCQGRCIKMKSFIGRIHLKDAMKTKKLCGAFASLIRVHCANFQAYHS
ncbi:hypothetical protein ACOME3_007896 [Neoechinorhynchus agilis]